MKQSSFNFSRGKTQRLFERIYLFESAGAKHSPQLLKVANRTGCSQSSEHYSRRIMKLLPNMCLVLKTSEITELRFEQTASSLSTCFPFPGLQINWAGVEIVSGLEEEAPVRMNAFQLVEDLQLYKLKSKYSVFQMFILLFADKSHALEIIYYL